MANIFLQGLEQSNVPQQNPFMSNIQPSEQQQQEEPSGNWFMDGVTAFNRQFSRMALGSLDLAAQAMPFSTEKFRGSLANINKQEEQDVAQAIQRSPKSALAGNILGSVGAGIAYGGPGVGAASSIPVKIAAGALGGAGMGALDYSSSGEERLKKAAIGGLLGGTVTAAGIGLSKGFQGIKKYVQADKSVAKEVADTIKADLGDNITANQLQTVASKYGMSRTPGQTVGGLTRQKEGMLRTSTEGQIAARKLDVAQTKETLGVVRKVIDDIAPQGTKELKDQLYKEMSTLEVGDDVVNSLKTNPLIKKQLESLTGENVTSATRALKENSVLKLDKVKQQIDDRLFKDARTLDPMNKMSAEEVGALKEARQQLIDTLDPVVTQYAPARKAAQKLILQDRYNKVLQNKGGSAGQRNDLNIDETWQALFPTKEAQQVFKQDIIKAGGKAETADDVITLLDQLRQSPLKRIWKRGTEDDHSIVFYGNKIGFAQKILDKMTGSRMAKAFIKLSFDPNWSDKIKEVLNKSSKESQNASFLKLLGNVIGTGSVRAASVGGARGMLEK